MKKFLLSMAFASLGLTVSSYAQTIFSDNFSTTTLPALSTGWSQNSPGIGSGDSAWFSATSASAGTTWASLTGAYNIPAHGTFMVVDDHKYPTQPHDTLKSPLFNIPGTYSSVWLNYDYFFYDATNSSSGISESAYLLGSSDGGTTWAIIDTLFGYGWNGSWVTSHVNMSGYTGANCRIGITYSDGGGAILGVAVNNINVLNLTADSAAVSALSFNDIQNGISINGATLGFTIQNLGVNVTTFNAQYTINGGAPVSQTFTTPTIAPFSSQSYTFTTAMAGLVATMTNTVVVTLTSVNGVAQTGSGDTKSATMVLASSDGQRSSLVEEFTSSTCPPCMEFASSFDPLCTTLGADNGTSNFNIIKYQMNWPDRDNDRSYNNDGFQRRSYYNVNSIPMHFVNGVVDNYNWSYPFTSADDAYFTNEFTVTSTANKAFLDMTSTYQVDTVGKKLYITVTVTPHFTKSGTYHVYIAACDKHYENIDNEWGMLNYYNVMRQMWPSGTGNAVTSWTDGVSVTYYDTAVAYTSTNWVPASTTPADSSLYPTQMSNEFWNNPLLGSEVIAFVEEDGTQSIMQSLVVDPTYHASTAINYVNTVSKVSGMNIFPNPTANEASLTFNLEESGNVNIKIMEYTGNTVSEVSNSFMTAGNQKVTIPTGNIASGNYLVVVTTATGSNMQRLTVSK